MSHARAIVSRSFRQLRAAKSTFRAQHPVKRGYASAGPKAKASDLPWLITSIAVTVPGTFLLLNSGNLNNPFSYPLPGSKHHGHHDGEEDHEGGEEEGIEGGEEATEGEEKSEGEDSEKKDEEKSEDGEKQEGGADSGENAAGGEREVETGDDNRKIIKPDAKGGFKRRVESGNSQKLGMEDEGTSGTDEAAPSKEEVGGSDTQSGKQAGLTNTDTKHSTDPTENPDQSTKGEGVPETAKMQGTVDPSRPQK